LVLDLRGNPGGLLEQAAKIADRFLEDGVIVSTVGTAEGREEKRATRHGTEPNYPSPSWSTARARAPARSWPVP